MNFILNIFDMYNICFLNLIISFNILFSSLCYQNLLVFMSLCNNSINSLVFKLLKLTIFSNIKFFKR